MRGSPVRHPGHSRRPVKNVRKDKNYFSRTADRVHPVNTQSIARGGVRL